MTIDKQAKKPHCVLDKQFELELYFSLAIYLNAVGIEHREVFSGICRVQKSLIGIS